MFKYASTVRARRDGKKNLVLGTISVLVVFATAIVAVSCITQAVYAFVCREIIDAPIAASGDNVYVTWVTNKTGNWEVMFRASNDSGKTFANKINLSQSPNTNSFHSNVAASGLPRLAIDMKFTLFISR